MVTSSSIASWAQNNDDVQMQTSTVQASLLNTTYVGKTQVDDNLLRNNQHEFY